MEIKLVKNKALVITGKKDRTKYSMARKIASEHGSYAEVTVIAILNYFGLGQALMDGVDTIIVQGCDLNNEEEARTAKQLVASKKIIANVMFKEPREVPTPNFIFVSLSADPFKPDVHDRRFHILEV